MACGTELNSYATLDSAVVVLPSGDRGGHRRRRRGPGRWPQPSPRSAAGLLRLRDQIRADPAAVAEIRRLYAIKNTMGYGLNSFLDHERPAKILEHLMVGSEGTLGFVAEATFRTVPAHPYAATGLLIFTRLADATAALPALERPVSPPSSSWTPPACGSGRPTPQADAALRGLAVG